MRVCFLGCRDTFSEPFLQLLQGRKDVEVVGVVTGGTRGALPAAECAIVASYGRRLSRAQLEQFPGGAVNIHPSVLPSFRGAAPAEWQILRRAPLLGVSLIRLSPSIDAGPLLAQASWPAPPRITTPALLQTAVVAALPLLNHLLDHWDHSLATAVPQPLEGLSYAPKIGPDMAHVNWTHWDPVAFDLHFRALAHRFAGLSALFGPRQKLVKITALPPAWDPTVLAQQEELAAAAAAAQLRPEAGSLVWDRRRNALLCRLGAGGGIVPISKLKVAGGKGEMDAEAFFRGYLDGKDPLESKFLLIHS